MDMIEKVRAALLAELRKGETNCVADYREEGGDDEVFIDGLINGRELARAAIEAMREPSQNMIDAIDDNDVYSFWSTYQDAIDAALNPRTSPEAPSSE